MFTNSKLKALNSLTVSTCSVHSGLLCVSNDAVWFV